MLPKNLEAVFLDFDGVVIESADIKTQAFYALYLPYGEKIAEQAKNYHIQYQGINRNQKFNAIHKNFLNRECHQEESDTLSKRFSEIVFQEIIECPFVEGIIEFLKKMTSNNTPVFLLSATPDEELKIIVKERQIDHYFKKIFGAPSSKVESGALIMNQFGLKSEDTIFIGDSESDLKAAETLKIPFLGRSLWHDNPIFKDYPTIKNFSELL